MALREGGVASASVSNEDGVESNLRYKRRGCDLDKGGVVFVGVASDSVSVRTDEGGVASVEVLATKRGTVFVCSLQ